MAHITNEPNIDLVSATSTLNSRQRAAVDRIADRLEKLIKARHETEALEQELKLSLKETLKPAYFEYNESATEQVDTNHTFDLGELQVNFVNSYFIKDSQHAQEIIKLLGANHPLTKYINESQKITIDVTGMEPNEANELAKQVTKDCLEYQIRPQVERKTITSPEFHDLRHVYLTPQDNLTLDNVLPMQVQVSVIE